LLLLLLLSPRCFISHHKNAKQSDAR